MSKKSSKKEPALLADDQYRQLFEQMEQGFHIIELLFDADKKPVDYRYLEANTAFERQTGLKHVIGKLSSENSANAGADEYEIYNGVVKTGEPAHFDQYNAATDRWYNTTVIRVGEKADGRLAIIFNDITERKQVEMRQGFILKLSDALRHSSNPTEIQHAAMKILAEQHDVMRAAYLDVAEDGDTMTMAARFEQNAVPTPSQLKLSHYGADFAETFRNGQTLYVCDTELEARSEEERIAYRSIGVRAWIVAPLVKEGRLFAVVGVQAATPRNWTPTDVQMVDELAVRTWEAVERAKAEEALHQGEEKYRSEAARLQAILQSMGDAVYIGDATGITLANQAALDQLGYNSFHDLNKHIGLLSTEVQTRDAQTNEIILPEDQVFARALHGEQQVQNVRIRRIAGGTERIVRSAASPVIVDGKIVAAVAVNTDITEQWEISNSLLEREVWLKGQRQAFQSAMSGKPLADSLQPLVNTIVERSKGNARAAFYMIPRGGEGLHLVAGMTSDYAEDVNGFKVGSDSLACGLAMYTGEPVLTHDIEEEPRWIPFREMARKHNYRGCWSFPVRAKGGEVLGTFAIYYVEPRSPAPPDLEMADVLAQTAAIIISREIELSERSRVEKALRNSELTRRMALEAFDIGMTVWYPQGDYTESDDRFFELFGLKEGGVINRETALNQLIYPEDRDHYAGLVENALNPAGDGKLYDEYRVIYPDGSIHWLATTGQTIFEGDPPMPVRMYGMVQDISIRKEAEQLRQRAEAEYRHKLETEVRERTEELQENHRLIETIYNTTQVGMSVFRPVYQGNEIIDFEIVIVNKRVEESSGRDDLPGKLYAKEFPGIKKMGLFDTMVKAIESGKAERKDYQYTHEGINQYYSTVFIRNDDLLVASNLNMTEQRQAEEKIRELEAEQRQEIVRTTFNALEEERYRIAESLHNGIGQILYGIKISLAGLEPGDQNFDQNKNYTDKLLTEAIKETRRVSHELMPATLEQFGLRNAIDDICAQLANGTKFSCQIAGLRGRLERYLELAVYRTTQELMTNIVKHAHATEADIVITISSQDIIIRVSDNGRGIDLSPQSKPGIGLASIRSKIRLMNGSVDIKSKPGEGTMIEVTIPMPETTLKKG